ncbi:MAG: hypothetical protein COV76_04870 [Candidatus Omnitrophica bacterium CG11_big_fil_rev_8_21_14_0_20_64_10]|nr:MAG: hypothetical protein COV76_04870 [Candidatus Omnitrophica bacterium CG11_big_fil_rev_8_21_14_0_20_64_10]
MIIRLRRIVFWFLVAVYLIACPWLLLYARGIILQPARTMDPLVETGLIHVATQPAGARLFLENRRFAQKTPTAIRELLPGPYRLSIRLNGHRPWERTIQVQPSKTGMLDPILLLPRRIRIQPIGTTAWTRLFPLEKTGFLFLASGKTAQQCALYEVDRNRLYPVPVPWPKARLKTVHHEPGSRRLLLEGEAGGARKWLAVSLSEKPAARDLTPLIPEGTEEILWDPSAPEQLFAVEGTAVHRIDTEQGALFPRWLEGVRGLAAREGQLTVLKTSGRLEWEPLADRTDPTVLDDSGEALDWLEETFYRIHRMTETTTLFLGGRGQLLSSRLPHLLEENGVRGLRPEGRTKQAAVWTGKRLALLDLEPEPAAAGGFEKGATLDWVYSRGREIRQAVWVRRGAYLLILDRDTVRLLETATRKDPALNWSETGALEEILEVRPGSGIHWDERRGILYGLERKSGRLFRAALAPPRKEGL